MTAQTAHSCPWLRASLVVGSAGRTQRLAERHGRRFGSVWARRGACSRNYIIAIASWHQNISITGFVEIDEYIYI